MPINTLSNPTTATIIGCGHSESLINHNSCILIENQQGRLLIDCGHTTKKALHEQGYSISDIDAIFITHVHGDHVFGLERFAYESLFKYNKKIRLYFHESLYEELWDQTLKGSLSRIGEGDATFSDYFDIRPITGKTFEDLGLRFDIFPVKHTPNKPCYGILVDQKLLYTSDTTTIPDTLKERTFSFIIHDMTTAPSPSPSRSCSSWPHHI